MVIGLTGIILVIVGVIILWGGKKKTDTSTYGITEMTNSEITQETEIFGQEISNSQSSKELDRDQTLAAIERFCREQNPDLNNMSQDEYFFYWELTIGNITGICSHVLLLYRFFYIFSCEQSNRRSYDNGICTRDNGWRGSRSRGISDLGLYRLIYNYTG